ncbi:hypothetical protein GOP47_0002035 [Adiantum capillus-veneris]|uniref:Uncharacterized protein n=1 Tax=Adiantum capillus-veneris TaxID=13818 RepID=A0A9D4V9Y3_ADICA|nr:hypothetical protein GOP47_0002035 [Adiantum capillus-veneris]
MAAKLMMRRSFWYWDRHSDDEETQKSHSSASRAGVVVVLGWMLSRRKNLASYTRLYKSCGWDCLVCHPQVFNLVFPSGATTLAVSVLEELAKELEKHSCPVVFAVFSGGHKACLYKIIQILLGNCSDVRIEEGKFAEVMRSLAGLIFDSSPVDAVSHLGAKFVSHQVLTLQPGRPIGVVSWVAYAVSRGVDVVFSRQLGRERIDLWKALYSSVKIGPILFFCSENDKLAPVETIQIFSSNLRKLGGKVDMVVWEESEHVGHFRRYPEQYSAEVVKLLAEAAAVYSGRISDRSQDGSEHVLTEVGTSFAPISASWTDLPESITTEISRVARLPHVHVRKGRNKAHEPFHGVELETCATSLVGSCDASRASYTLGMRSKL